MRLGIRCKLVGALVLAGLLPLALLLAAGSVAARGAGQQFILFVWPVALICIIIVTLCFVGGLWIAQRELIQPVLMLAKGAKELEQGHFDFRLKSPDMSGTVFRHDELGKLADDFNRMADRLQHSVADLERANRVKQQFIDVASHELRTPITYMLGALELAQRQGGADEAMLAKLLTKAQRLSRIVENMFKLLQSGSYEAKLRLLEVDLDRLIRASVNEIEPFSQARHQQIQVLLPERTIRLTADAEKLRDIVDNLLSNAIRFSPDDTIIRVEAFDHGSTVELTVSDQGPGVEALNEHRLFEPFPIEGPELVHHSSGEYQYMTRGIGLGMSVVKRFVEMHHGSLTAEPADIGGTRVRVLLPKEQEQLRRKGESREIKGQVAQ